MELIEKVERYICPICGYEHGSYEAADACWKGHSTLGDLEIKHIEFNPAESIPEHLWVDTGRGVYHYKMVYRTIGGQEI